MDHFRSYCGRSSSIPRGTDLHVRAAPARRPPDYAALPVRLAARRLRPPSSPSSSQPVRTRCRHARAATTTTSAIPEALAVGHRRGAAGTSSSPTATRPCGPCCAALRVAAPLGRPARVGRASRSCSCAPRCPVGPRQPRVGMATQARARRGAAPSSRGSGCSSSPTRSASSRGGLASPGEPGARPRDPPRGAADTAQRTSRTDAHRCARVISPRRTCRYSCVPP